MGKAARVWLRTSSILAPQQMKGKIHVMDVI